MNLPNKITISRICLIPIFMVFLLAPLPMGQWEWLGVEIPVAHFIAALLFIFAAATDWLDGYYARKLNLVTNFGKFLDPLADKLLITAALIGLVELGALPAWMAIVIISREFAVTGIRLVAAADGQVIAASNLGKWKTVWQIIGISALMLYNLPFEALSIPFAMISIWIATILTLLSGIDYFMKNRHVILKSK
ncbi:phosphatidylglycerophosphate synthase [Alkalihalophilus pseudofirmus OF4]|uniref:CDP-diacylglycerol--glycerol-3-phosphate 3-phosphatidyltransferase n=3 Tax=Alkalihalophilus TaxID=2893060 RepID=D3FTX7_ALKPO|nr:MULTISPECIES: CDP-diacylglycerol--glycerol-3-phosphate 3-phosphatidyltransferase [Alkalihalophilus]ADC51958.1 phosphatidylglycerophosphate synthase [Alkalihalophilus pseudofirmus OF4]ERN53356.1 CDP-diacylglycerol--glycerol-3-phosphate 3-phosphatidyltransferase [Alkalihalophilus marmarensis DSM 21297]MCM3489513.1 CDP-diacylglycerol--glycerol-3-phosphate 3-phosphatidyltransferase [Alkalihalophilus marmarensis]MDV2885206.1 CDP-diacylglycerol--glycerol-3-phosphate 3-phosphatidyltransferase [Alka